MFWTQLLKKTVCWDRYAYITEKDSLFLIVQETESTYDVKDKKLLHHGHLIFVEMVMIILLSVFTIKVKLSHTLSLIHFFSFRIILFTKNKEPNKLKKLKQCFNRTLFKTKLICTKMMLLFLNKTHNHLNRLQSKTSVLATLIFLKIFQPMWLQALMSLLILTP